MGKLKRFFGLAIASALATAVGVPVAMANEEQPAADTVTIIVRGQPNIYCGNEVDQPDKWPIITRIENVPRNATFKDIKDRLPEGKQLFGYVQADFYSMSHGGRGNLEWADDKPLVTEDGYVREIHYPYIMTAAVGYETHGADNATDSAFAWYTIPDYTNSHKVKIPSLDPVRSNTEPGRSADNFLGWFKDEGLTQAASAQDSVRQEWTKLWNEMKKQGATEYPEFEDPDNPGCMRKVKALVLHAGWDEAPLLQVKDVTITEGDEFDPMSLVKSATDAEDTTPTVSFDSQPDSSVPGTYTVNVTATDSKGATHTLPATLTVLPKPAVINKAPTLEVKDVTITVGDAFTPADVVVSVSDEEDTVAGKEPTVTYTGEYDVNTPGTYTITVKATDAGGASITKTATLTVKAAQESTDDTVEPEKPAVKPAKVPGGSGSAVHKTVLAKTGLDATSVAILALGCTLAGLGAMALRRRAH